MKITLLLFLTLLILAACATDAPPRVIGSPRRYIPPVREAPPMEEIEPAPEAFPVLIRRDAATFSMYEPQEGAYLAAWLMPELTIRLFEHQAEKRHAAYVTEIFLGDELPITWLLHCIASLATPIFIVHPPNDEEIADIPPQELVIYLAQRLGAFNLPMFVAFYPTHDMTPTEFTLLFRQARNAFRLHAPLAAFVWVAPSHTATPQNPFFPGHSFVDWVALGLFAGWSESDGFTDILQKLEIFHASFQEHKPIMLLPVAVSHFTRGDYTYRMNDASAEIARIYDALRTFPRVGLIAYGDAFTLARAENEDFSVSLEAQLSAAYAEAISHGHFLTSLERNNTATERLHRSAFHGYVYGGKIFLSPELLASENISTAREVTYLGGKPHICSQKIPEKNIRACMENRVILIETNP